MNESTETMTTDDLFALTVKRWSWQSEEDHADRIQDARSRRDRKAEAFHSMAKTVAENDLPWPAVDLHPYNRENDEDEVLVACWWVEDMDDFRTVARAVRRAVGGLTAKSNKDGSLTATVIRDGVGYDVRLTPEGSPCKQVQVGTEEKTVREVEQPATYREVIKDVPVYEWECPPSVLDEDVVAEAEKVVAEEEDTETVDA